MTTVIWQDISDKNIWQNIYDQIIWSTIFDRNIVDHVVEDKDEVYKLNF